MLSIVLGVLGRCRLVQSGPGRRCGRNHSPDVNLLLQQHSVEEASAAFQRQRTGQRSTGKGEIGTVEVDVVDS